MEDFLANRVRMETGAVIRFFLIEEQGVVCLKYPPFPIDCMGPWMEKFNLVGWPALGWSA